MKDKSYWQIVSAYNLAMLRIELSSILGISFIAIACIIGMLKVIFIIKLLLFLVFLFSTYYLNKIANRDKKKVNDYYKPYLKGFEK